MKYLIGVDIGTTATKAALSIDGQMAGVLGIDENWNAVTQYDSWLDTRCAAYVEHIKNHFEDKVLTLSGLPSMVAHCAKRIY